MNQIIQTYIDPNFHYVFSQGPDLVESRKQALFDGLNCISLSHLVLKDLFGYKLPFNLKSSELSNDAIHFETVNDLDNMQLGDLVWFGLAEPTITIEQFKPLYEGEVLVNWRDYPIKHVAIYTDEHNEHNEPLLPHATSRINGTVIWPLSKFNKYQNYQNIYCIKRLNQK